MTTINLKDLERRSFRTRFEDGLWDIYLGVILCMMGIGPWMTSLEISPFWILGTLTLCISIACGLFIVLKKKIPAARSGQVRFSEERRNRVKKVNIIAAVCVLITLLIFVLSTTHASQAFRPLAGIPAAVLVFGIMAMVFFAIGAHYLDFPRLYLYGVLYGQAYPIAFYLASAYRMRIGFLLTCGIPGAYMILTGVILYRKFTAKTRESGLN